MLQVQLRLSANLGPSFPGSFSSWAPVDQAACHCPLQHIVWLFVSPLAGRGPCLPHSSHLRFKVTLNFGGHGQGAVLPGCFLQVTFLFGFIYVLFFFFPLSHGTQPDLGTLLLLSCFPLAPEEYIMASPKWW